MQSFKVATAEQNNQKVSIFPGNQRRQTIGKHCTRKHLVIRITILTRFIVTVYVCLLLDNMTIAEKRKSHMVVWSFTQNQFSNLTDTIDNFHFQNDKLPSFKFDCDCINYGRILFKSLYVFWFIISKIQTQRTIFSQLKMYFSNAPNLNQRFLF